MIDVCCQYTVVDVVDSSRLSAVVIEAWSRILYSR